MRQGGRSKPPLALRIKVPGTPWLRVLGYATTHHLRYAEIDVMSLGRHIPASSL